MKKTKLMIEIETDKMKTFVEDGCIEEVEDIFHQVVKEKIENYLEQDGLTEDVLDDERLIMENGECDTFTDYCEPKGSIKISISHIKQKNEK